MKNPPFRPPNPARYDAALELCPQHKEGLVGRGAALTNLGKAREVCDGSVNRETGVDNWWMSAIRLPDDSGLALVVGLYGKFGCFPFFFPRSLCQNKFHRFFFLRKTTQAYLEFPPVGFTQD